MDDQRSVPNYYAILIGINAYQKRPLRGCVQDVQNLKAYLQGTVSHINIRTFTATGDNKPGSTSFIEDPKFWPTGSNILSAFEEVSQSAKAGDAVYIHYSGHGTHQEPNDRSYNKSTGDLALVVLSDKTDKSEQYLWGRSLAYDLNAMVKKGLAITLVLDCCFSASVYRLDPRARFLPYDSEIGSIAQLETDWRPHDSIFDSSANRDISILPKWLIDPDKYAIFVACGPFEEAGEIEFDDGRVVGKLSYFLMKVLQEDGGVRNTVNHIYERVRSDYRTEGQRQSPVLYGNKGQGFLGPAIMETSTKSIPVSEKPDGSLELQAGLAHGVGVGDKFTLYPSGLSAFVEHGNCMAAQVTHAGAFASNIEKSCVCSTPDRKRWMAKPLSQCSLRKYAVRLGVHLSQVDELQTALHKRSLESHTEFENRPFTFRIAIDSNKVYEVYEESGHASANVLTILSSKASIDEISNTIEHLARFKLVKDLINVTSTEAFRNSFDIYIISQGNRYYPNDLIRTSEDHKLELNVQNHGNCDLYLSAYDLGPSWQVEIIGRETYTRISPKGDYRYTNETYKRMFGTKIPNDMREKHHFCDDILKVFLTSHPTSFDFLELPELGKLAKMEKMDRTDNRDNCLEGDWVGLSFHIRTSVPVSSQEKT